jgi:hypothetical protein
MQKHPRANASKIRNHFIGRTPYRFGKSHFVVVGANNSTTNTGANVYIGIDGSSFPVIIPPTRTAGFWLAGDGTLQATTTVATTTISIGRAPNP